MPNNSDYRKLTDYIKEIYAPNKVNWGHVAKQIDSFVKGYDLTYLQILDIIKYVIEYENKELWLKYLLEQMETENVQKMADIILAEAIDNNYGIPKDDMTVIVCKIEKN